jgi:hypothetical protein
VTQGPQAAASRPVGLVCSSDSMKVHKAAVSRRPDSAAAIANEVKTMTRLTARVFEFVCTLRFITIFFGPSTRA